MTSKTSLKKTENENIIPFRPLSMLEEMERMFENFMPQSWMRAYTPGLSLLEEQLPKVDIIDQDDTLLIRAMLPGVKKENLEVSTTDHSLTIRGKTHEEHKEEKKGEYYRKEISSGNFLRTVALPALVDESGIKANFNNGMLEVTIPKKENEKRHTVKID